MVHFDLQQLSYSIRVILEKPENDSLLRVYWDGKPRKS